jgi:SAM-dependent methyltransferase
MPLFAIRTRVEGKETQAWGEKQAVSLWSNLYERYSPSVDGRTVLDIGCSWGYMLKFLAEQFRPARLIGTDVAAHWQTSNHGWNYRRLGELVEFHVGDLPDIAALGDRSIDLMLCTSVFQYMTPEQLEANLEHAYDLLRPGGQMVLRTRVFTSYIGADLHDDLDLPYAHLLYGERDIAAALHTQGKEPPYLNWLTASTYLAIFARAGFEVVDARRRPNRVAPDVLDRVGAAFPWIAPDELTCAELEAQLVRPIGLEDLAVPGVIPAPGPTEQMGPSG